MQHKKSSCFSREKTALPVQELEEVSPVSSLCSVLEPPDEASSNILGQKHDAIRAYCWFDTGSSLRSEMFPQPRTDIWVI